MYERVRDLFPKLLFELACAAFLSASAHAAPVSVHKVSALPTVRALSMSTGGRMLITPSPTLNSFGGKDYKFQWPGSYFRAAFEGSSVFFQVERGGILHIVVDAQPAIWLVRPEAAIYELDGLEKTKHTIGIFFATENVDGQKAFGGFAIPADEKALRPPQRYRQIEFIGDSQTVGYGDLSTTRDCTWEEAGARTDDTRAFGALTANHYDADYQVNAISGRGVVRNYAGSSDDTLPQAYPYVLFDKKQMYMEPDWKPEVLVISLGNNDFATSLNPAERWKSRDELRADYEAKYLQFLGTLRAQNPHAYLIVWTTDIGTGEVKAEAQKVAEQMKKSGDQHVTFLLVKGLHFDGCHWHPSFADQKVISEKLVQLIDEDQVWKGR